MLIIKKRGEKIFENVIKAVGIISILPVFLIIGYIIYKGLPAISWEFLTEMPKNGMREGGIFPAIIGTIYLTIGTIVVSVPFGIFTGIYLVEYAKDNLLTRIINLTIINLAGIPSIIYGLFGMALFVIFLGFDVSIVSGSLTLGIMCLPVIITSTRESLLAIPNHLREASLALGATKWETITKVVLPAALPGILTGVILSISRAAGETAPIMFTAVAFYLPFLPETPWDQVMALPYHLYVISTQVPNMPISYMNGTLFVLVVITISFNLIGAVIRQKFNNK
ncbi:MULTISPECIES: phosphate ABC transporter permease PstA [Fusobacterium]|jgi:phosphate transport system permease protein|uniref:Phosphate transport system permease protein PstA n=1 Tax=Fusobacterium varium ATCC 27725 TaxID=469618 RepID=A0ABM6U4C6_FUSVA|nr:MULTISPECIES: phosphate ABC transporter permease PstA [Fusobacterium]AVQ31176.1 phosphate ABC transporter permease PtsA [Fusobacterium varium ATCC 27725]EES62490.1 phosphate ABC transporter, permease protein PstA [Fusobacterium varium ATCC 27725]MCF0171318.1 phosphate ABC transporter permease PstA [Fusobacterium varium]MCF2673233.1 phosphate ABC transporter permease PstA [Fusobacterium varium]OFL85565.1 phosphate ABC transporter, permease protein PstA [Fusobacterium sp. HMSC073F01]